MPGRVRCAHACWLASPALSCPSAHLLCSWPVCSPTLSSCNALRACALLFPARLHALAGNVKISVLSKAPTDAGLLLKTVSKPIKALSACPQSPCVKDSTASAPAPTTTTPTPATPSALNITGNPMVDMMSVMSMLAGSSGLGATPLGMLLNYQTAMTVISGALGVIALPSRSCRQDIHELTHRLC